MNICDIAKAVSPEAEQEIVGIRPGEKLHEQMIGPEDAPYTYEFDYYYKILPAINNWDDDPDRIRSGDKVPENFCYSSDNNSEWMTVEELQRWIDKNKDLIGKI